MKNKEKNDEMKTKMTNPPRLTTKLTSNQLKHIIIIKMKFDNEER